MQKAFNVVEVAVNSSFNYAFSPASRLACRFDEYAEGNSASFCMFFRSGPMIVTFRLNCIHRSNFCEFKFLFNFRSAKFYLHVVFTHTLPS